MRKTMYWIICLQLLFVNAGLFGADSEEMPPRDGGMWQTLVMAAMAVAFMYFILIRPEQKRRKEAEEQRSRLKKGDRVTAMGIVGHIVKIQDQTVILKMYDGSKIEMLKAAITEVLPVSEEEAKKAAKDDE